MQTANPKLTDVHFEPDGVTGALNRLTHGRLGGMLHDCDAILLDTGEWLYVFGDRIRVVDVDDDREVTIAFDSIPEFDAELSRPVVEQASGDNRFGNIRAYGTDQTGGGIMVDWLEHRNGVLICVTDECICLYRATYGRFSATDDPTDCEVVLGLDNFMVLDY